MIWNYLPGLREIVPSRVSCPPLSAGSQEGKPDLFSSLWIFSNYRRVALEYILRSGNIVSDAWQIKSFRNPDAPHFPANSRNRHGQELCSRSGLSGSFQPGLMVKITRLILVGISHFYIHWLPDWINLYLTRREKHSAWDSWRTVCAVLITAKIPPNYRHRPVSPGHNWWSIIIWDRGLTWQKVSRSSPVIYWDSLQNIILVCKIDGIILGQLLASQLSEVESLSPPKTYFFFMTLLLAGDMQLTLMSVVPCLLQIAMENRPKLALMILMVWSSPQEISRLSPSHL